MKKLLHDSRVFLQDNKQADVHADRTNFKLFHQWRHELFNIPHTDIELIEKCAVCIDELLHSFLDRHAIDQFENAVAFVCTGIYAWGRVAPHNEASATNAELLVTRLLENAIKGEDDSSMPPQLEVVFSAMAYCWSQMTNNDKAPGEALKWMNVIVANPNMHLSTATFNAVLRAHAKCGLLEDVEHLVKTTTVDKDVYSYQILIQAWLDSYSPESSQKAYLALQEGIQSCLGGEHVEQLAPMFVQFLNKSKLNPRICEKALNQIIHLQQEYPSLPILQAQHFVIVMSAWASQGGAEKVKQLLGIMRNEYKSGNERLKPTYQVSIDS